MRKRAIKSFARHMVTLLAECLIISDVVAKFVGQHIGLPIKH